VSFDISIDLSGLNNYLDSKVEAVAEAVRPAAQAGAQVLYEAVCRNVDGLGKETGNLRASIYQAYSKDHSSDGEQATYHVSWNAKKAPHGHLVEYGYVQKFRVYVAKDGKFVTTKIPLASPKHIPPHSFVRSAISQFGAAEAAVKNKFLGLINDH
jgi:hypothetical protein